MVETGVKQGGILSPLLFIIFMDKCLNEIYVKEETEITFAYADDGTVTTGKELQLQEKVTRWNEVLTRHGMKVNQTKTEVMIVSR